MTDSVSRIIEESVDREWTLTKSIIYDCPALRAPICKWSNTARIIALKGAAQEDAEYIAKALAAPPAPTVHEKYKSTIAELCDCLEDIVNGKGGWAWEEVVQEARNLTETAPEPQIQEKTAPDITELRLCESERLILHSNQLYRFTVDENCARCRELAEAGKL